MTMVKLQEKAWMSLAEAQAGNRQALEILVREAYPLMFKTAFRYCRNVADAEDITQNACIRLVQSLRGFAGEARFETWLFRLVVNVAINWFRQNKRHVHAVLEADLHESGGFSAEEACCVREVMSWVDGLPEREKWAVLLVLRDGFTHREAAEIMECSEGTVSWYIHEARKKLEGIRS